ncbi:MAG: hypothetical protein CMI02_00575 [Oceanospirillaceae bacterium]|nr:hypothetical protein [Oceanospirillaceae bacterium]MBT10513.1 hypothetical protein [Oceanospirillaceae bacterium]|tara:strand:- start:92438 stop:93292 length:855 start_codon:yes stop_codon:yes gene_type:complete
MSGSPEPLNLQQNPARVRRELAALLQQHSTTSAAWQAGLMAETPGTAFFCAYQAVMRCLDPALPGDVWAAFCISERGMGSLRNMTTQYTTAGGLSGSKSHVMLAGEGLDYLYVVARGDREEQLVCVTVPMQAQGVSVEDVSKPQPFFPDVLHKPVTFSQVTAEAVFSQDAHRALNRPFRYWEDIHLALALAAWLVAACRKESRVEAAERLCVEAEALKTAFSTQPERYHLAALDAFENLQQTMTDCTEWLTGPALLAWQRDQIVMAMTAPLRRQIRAKLSAPSL